MKSSAEQISANARLASGLEAGSELSRAVEHPGHDLRPCIAVLWKTSLGKADLPNRNEAALILACELSRIGKSHSDIYDFVERWNRHNRPPLRPSELTKAVRNGCSGKYRYTCKNPNLESLCVGDECPFVSHTKTKRKRTSNIVFHLKGWQRHLSNRQALIYLGLPMLEKTRQVGVGGKIYANHKQIAHAAGVCARDMGRDLKVLAEVGLIEYTPGTPRKWEGKASVVRRVIPIPNVPTENSKGRGKA